MDEIRPSSFCIDSNCQQSLIPHIQKTLSTMITENHTDFIITVTCFAKKDELKGVRNEFRTPFLSFLGARPRLAPVQRYRYYKQIRKDS